MKHHQIFNLEKYSFIKKFNEKITNHFNGTITKSNSLLTLFQSKITKIVFIYQSPK